jgi:hypothetical protein
VADLLVWGKGKESGRIGASRRAWRVARVILVWICAWAGSANGGVGPGQSADGSGQVWLEITEVRAGVAFLKLHGAQAGVYYQILAQTRLGDPTGTPVQVCVGDAGQESLPVAIAAGNGVGSLFFRARTQAGADRLWLECPPNALSVPGQVVLVLHNSLPNVQYDVLTKSELTAATWSAERSVWGTSSNTTPVTLSQNGRTNLLIWIRTGDNSAASSSWSADTLDLTADAVTALYAGGAGASVTADSTRISADIRP